MDTPWTHARLLQWMLRFNQWPASITHTCRAWTPPVKGWLCGNILPFTKALPHAVDLPSHTCLPPYLYNMFATFAALLGARGREQGEGPNMRSLEDGVETEGFKGSVAHQETLRASSENGIANFLTAPPHPWRMSRLWLADGPWVALGGIAGARRQSGVSYGLPGRAPIT